MGKVFTHPHQAIISNKYFVILVILTCFCAQISFCAFQFESKYYGGLLLQNSESKSSGMWDTWQKCNEGSFVRGFRLRIEDSVISGIILYCSKLQVSRISELFKLFSKNEFGTWSRIHFCQDGPAVGFQLKMDPYTNKIVNIRLTCSGPEGSSKITTEAIEMREREIIDNRQIDNPNMIWTPKMDCYKRQALCGIQPRFSTNITEELQITDMRMSCCEIMTQAETCIPEDKWELLFEYDNREGINTVKYSYNKKVGIGKIGQHNYRESPSVNPYGRANKFFEDDHDRNRGPFYESEIFVDHNLESYQFKILKHRFDEVMGHSFKTGFDWTKSPSDTWAEEKSFPIDVEIRPGSFTKVFQITGMCGDYRIRPNKIYQKGVLKDRLRDPENSKEFIGPSDQEVELKHTLTKRPLQLPVDDQDDEIRPRPVKRPKTKVEIDQLKYQEILKIDDILRDIRGRKAKIKTEDDLKSFENDKPDVSLRLRSSSNKSKNHRIPNKDAENDDRRSKLRPEKHQNFEENDEEGTRGSRVRKQETFLGNQGHNQGHITTDVGFLRGNSLRQNQLLTNFNTDMSQEMTPPPEPAFHSAFDAPIPGQQNLIQQQQQIRQQNQISQQQQQILQQQQQLSALGQQQQIQGQQQGQQQGQEQAMQNQMQMQMQIQEQQSLEKPLVKLFLGDKSALMIILSFIMGVFLYLT